MIASPNFSATRSSSYCIWSPIQNAVKFTRQGHIVLAIELERLLNHSRVSGTLRTLESQIDDYEFDAARITLEKNADELGLTQ